MDGLSDDIIIPIKGLSPGEHSFKFVVGAEFFSKFGNSRIKDADCSVTVDVLRHQTVMGVVCRAAGYVVVECDRCLDDLTIKVDVEQPLTVGFGSVDSDSDDDDVMVVDSADTQMSLDQFVYDYVCLSLPLVMVHPDGKCNPQMMKILEQSGKSCEDSDMDSEKDTPFAGLKELLENKNN